MDAYKLENSWAGILKSELSSPYMQQLQHFLHAETRAGKTIFPQPNEYFRSLNLTPPENVKIVILGQDPYHGDGQAHGLAFSVHKGQRPPPSLRNIYKELENDLGITPPQHGFLENWAKQGILLLNTVLTVEKGQATSHQKKGWEQFTDAIITHINERDQPIIFMLWGSHAQKKEALLHNPQHLILKAPHPSPLSAHRGFLGCGHFSKANTFLKEKECEEIDWSLEP
jgi:uracil-DNA glycosylase